MKSKEKRRTISVTLGLLEEYTGIDDAIDILLQAKQRADAENIRDVMVEIEKVHGYYGEVHVTVRIEGRRTETAEEVAVRLEAEQQDTIARIKKLERELQALRGN